MDDRTDIERSIMIERYEIDNNIKIGVVYEIDKAFFVQDGGIMPSCCRGMLISSIPELDTVTLMLTSKYNWINGKLVIAYVGDIREIV